MNLLPQDVLIMLKFVVSGSNVWTYASIAHDLEMSSSMVFNGVKRAAQARLFDPNRKKPRLRALEEFLVHGAKYAFAPDIGTMTRGMPTAFASPALRDRISFKPEEIYVWPHPIGENRGLSFSPLYKSVPEICMQDGTLHEILGLVDALRLGGAREGNLARELLGKLLREYARRT